MTTDTTPDSRDIGQRLGQCLHAPLRAQTYRNLIYLVAMTPLGTIYFTLLLIGGTFVLSFLIIAIGIPLLIIVLVMVVELAEFERTLVRWLLQADVPSPSPVETQQGLWVRSKHLVVDSRTWKAVAYLFSVFIYGTMVGWVIVSGLVTSGSFLFAPLYYKQAAVVAYGPFQIGAITLDLLFGWNNLLVGLTTTFRIGSWQIETLPGALLVSSLGVVLLLVTFTVANILMGVWGRYARVMLTVPRYWRLPSW